MSAFLDADGAALPWETEAVEAIASALLRFHVKRQCQRHICMIT